NREDSWNRVLKNASENVEWQFVDENDPAIVLYTAGRTSKPEGVTHTHSSIFNTCLSRKISQNLKEEDVSLVATAICHAGGSIGLTFPTLYSGGSIVLLEKADPLLFLKLFETYRPTLTLLLPTQLLDVV